MFKKDLKNFSFVTIGRVISTLGQTAFFILFATISDPKIYGELSYVLSIAGTSSVIIRFGFSQTVVVYQAKEKKQLANQINVFVIICSSIGAVILLFFNPLAAFLSISISFFVMNQNNYLGLKKYKKLFIFAISRGLLFIVLPIGLFFVFDLSGALLGMALSYMIGGFDFLTKIKIKNLNFRELFQDIKFILNNFGVNVSQNLPRWVDKLAIVPLLGFEIAGVYQLNLQILFATSIIPSALHSFLLSEESSGHNQNKINIFVLMVSIIMILVVVLLSPMAIKQIFPQFVEGIPSLQILIFSLMPITISYILLAKLQAKESTRAGYSAIIRVGLLIGLIIILGPELELIGLSIAFLLSSIGYTIFLAIIMKKQYEIKK